MSKGFTLMEMLVVVIIVAILASIALPQYQWAVRKARWMEIVTATEAVAEAEEMHWLQYRTYTDQLSDLDVKFSLPRGTMGEDDEEIAYSQESTYVTKNGYVSIKHVEECQQGMEASCKNKYSGPYISSVYVFGKHGDGRVAYTVPLPHSASNINRWDEAAREGWRICHATNAYGPNPSGNEFCQRLGGVLLEGFNTSGGGNSYKLN